MTPFACSVRTTHRRIEHSNGKHYEVMKCLREGGRKDETVWKPIHSLTADSFQNETEFRILEQCLHQLDRYECDSSSPFARRGWLAELRRWTAEVIGPFGLELTGPFCQYNAGPSFSLIRFGTNGPAVWFKAVGEPNQREFPITLKLSQQFPEIFPSFSEHERIGMAGFRLKRQARTYAKHRK